MVGVNRLVVAQAKSRRLKNWVMCLLTVIHMGCESPQKKENSKEKVREIAVCLSRSARKERDLCLDQLAATFDNPGICKNIESNLTKEHCINWIAENRRDWRLCTGPDDSGGGRNFWDCVGRKELCIKKIAVRKGDVDLCLNKNNGRSRRWYCENTIEDPCRMTPISEFDSGVEKNERFSCEDKKSRMKCDQRKECMVINEYFTDPGEEISCICCARSLGKRTGRCAAPDEMGDE